VPHFNINTKAELGKLLCVLPQEIDQVLRNRHNDYRLVPIAKADGTSRLLRVPHDQLKFLQNKVRRHVLDAAEMLDCIHGGVRGRSARTNAKAHVGKTVVFTVDVKDFFPGIGPNTVAKIFRVLGFEAEALQSLIDVTIWEDQLPQGAPTSVALANLAMYRVDVRISTLARQNGFAYTRYVDDLTLSGSRRLLDFRGLIQRIVEEEGFRLNPAKLKTMLSGGRQTVTGIVVNQKLNLPREKRTEIRRQVVEASSRHPTPFRITRIRGQLAWLSYINPEKADRLRRRI